MTKIKIPRNAQPTLYIDCNQNDIQVLENFPYDKYELEYCNITNYMIKRKIQKCLQVYSKDESGNLGKPFGFLMLNVDKVFLYLLPYNYPLLFKLISDKIIITNPVTLLNWNREFLKYIQQIPYYYVKPLKIPQCRIFIL